MSGDYRPAAGDTVKVELEVRRVQPNGQLDLVDGRGRLVVYGGTTPEDVEFVKRRAPKLESGDVVYSNSGGVYLVGARRVSLTVTFGEVIDGGTVEALADSIAERPDYYRIVKHEENK